MFRLETKNFTHAKRKLDISRLSSARRILKAWPYMFRPFFHATNRSWPLLVVNSCQINMNHIKSSNCWVNSSKFEKQKAYQMVSRVSRAIHGGFQSMEVSPNHACVMDDHCSRIEGHGDFG